MISGADIPAFMLRYTGIKREEGCKYESEKRTDP